MQHRSRARTSIGAAALVVGSAALASCGLPQSSEFEQITGDDVQFDLDQTTTTTTTTVPPTTIVATSSTVAETTTTEIPTELVLIYFVSGSQLNSVSRPLASPAAPAQVLAALLEGPPTDIGPGLRTTIPESAGRRITVQKERGTAIIDLPADVFDTMPSRDQTFFFAQLVLTIGRLGGIGPVQFTQDGSPIQAIAGDGSNADTVTIDDYQNLLVGAPPQTTTTTVPPPPGTETPTGTSVPG